MRLNVIVTDKSNRSVMNLRQEDFRVEEDGVPQAITYFSTEAVPVSYALVVDNSGSMKDLLETLARTAASLMAANQPRDEASLLRFVSSEQVNVLVDFTTDPYALARGLSSMRTEGGQTAVIDGVYLGVEQVAGRRAEETNRRRALVLLTDGEDRSSYYKISELEKLLDKSDVQVFAIGIITNLDKEGGIIRKSARENAVKLLNKLAQETGGRVFYPQKMRDMIFAVNEISRDLRTQYVIGYQPTNGNRDGKFRKVKVRLSAAAGDGRDVHVREGYFAPGGKPGEKNESKEKRPRPRLP